MNALPFSVDDNDIINKVADRQAFVDLIKTAPQLTQEEAIAMHDSEAWKEWPKEALAIYQLTQDCLCVPWGVFHEAIEEAVGRPIWTHEFVDRDHLIDEYVGKEPHRTMAEIMQRLIDLAGGPEKILVLKVDGDSHE